MITASLTDRQTRRRLRGLLGCLVLGSGGVLMATGSVWIGAALGLLALWALARRHSVPVLVYHSISNDADWLPWARNIAVRPAVFAAQMAALHRWGWRVVPDRAVHAGKALPPRALALQFDDGYRDNLVHALPVLRRLGSPATIFASTDFIDPSDGVRNNQALRGYLNADELRAIDADPLFAIECHGTDHARVAVPGPMTPRDPAVWGGEADWLWSLIPGPKARWFEQVPPDVAQVPTSAPALTARQMIRDVQETPQDQSTRVHATLRRAHDTLSATLNRNVDMFCWPFDAVTPDATIAARAAGFRLFTGGRQDNRHGQATDTLSRTHVQDHAAGPAPVWVDLLVFRARFEVASGNLLWWPLAAAAAARRNRFSPILRGPNR